MCGRAQFSGPNPAGTVKGLEPALREALRHRRLRLPEIPKERAQTGAAKEGAERSTRKLAFLSYPQIIAETKSPCCNNSARRVFQGRDRFRLNILKVRCS